MKDHGFPEPGTPEGDEFYQKKIDEMHARHAEAAAEAAQPKADPPQTWDEACQREAEKLND